MLAGYLPFDDDYVDYLFRKIEKGVFKFPNHFSSGAKDLIRRILQVKPSKRISISAIKKHPWFCVFVLQNLFNELGDSKMKYKNL
jgi:serine/threonine protein kinase